MTLLGKLAIVLVAFVAILGFVLYTALRERRLGKTIAEGDIAAKRASDARVLAVIFTSIMGGMLLTLVVAWLVFL
jgi:hypothetical protein